MLYQELPPIQSTRLDRWGRWLAPAARWGCGPHCRDPAPSVRPAAHRLRRPVCRIGGAEPTPISRFSLEPCRASSIMAPDYSLVGSALALSREPTALTTDEGSLLIVNTAYRDRFGGSRSPLDLGADEHALQGLQLAKSMAWRDGAGCVPAVTTTAGPTPVEVERVGSQGQIAALAFPESFAG